MSKRAKRSTSTQFETIKAQFLAASQLGSAPDRQELIARNPRFAAELEQFFNDYDRANLITELPSAKTGVPTQFSDLTIDNLDSEETPFESPNPSIEFGDYELLEVIGHGGMGVVYKARQISLGRIVAIKMIKTGQHADRDSVERFRIEAEAAASLDHHGIVSIYEVGVYEGYHFFSMQYVGGTTLDVKLREGPFQPREAASITMKIANAIAYAHSQGVVHRDLKPSNVLLDENGEPKITDFGLAKFINEGDQLTRTGQVIGTPAFMAPEQARGSIQEITESTDIYSLGTLLYALLTGRAPYEATHTVDLLLQVLEGEPILPSRIDPQISKSLELICLRCMARKPTDRYGSAESVARDCGHYLRDEPLEIKSQGIVHWLRQWCRREPALVAHLVAICSFLIVLQTTFYFVENSLAYHARHMTVFVVWICLSLFLQKKMHETSWKNRARIVWITVDGLVITLSLFLAHSPGGPLLIGYPILIAASGMFVREKIVIYTVFICILSYIVLTLMRPAEFPTVRLSFFFVVGLSVLGGFVTAQVKRLRALNRFFDLQPHQQQP